METLYITIFFIFGTIMGSFYNVVGYRLPNGMSLIKPASHCPNCNHRLGAMELIPIISYIVQSGKCKCCHQKIAIFYPIFELLTGLMFVLSYLVFGFNLELIVALIFVSTLLIVMISDIKYMVIPDELLIFSGVTLFIARLLMGYNILTLLLNIIIPFVFLLTIKLLGDFIFKKESLGGGDIKLMIIFGLVMGYPSTIIVLMLASFIAFPVALIVLFTKKTNMIPFGPFLSIAALILYYFSISFDSVIKMLIAIGGR